MLLRRKSLKNEKKKEERERKRVMAFSDIIAF